MKLNDLEAEQLRHLDTRSELLDLRALIVEFGRQRVYDSIAERLGFEGKFSISSDGTVTIDGD